MVKIAFFDIDNTLTESRGRVTDAMARLLSDLSRRIKVAFISGGSFDDIRGQVLRALPTADLSNMIVLPCEGAELWTHAGGAWKTIYTHRMDEEKRKRIADAIGTLEKKALVATGNEIRGARIEDRGGLVSYHALGANAPLGEKYAWDPTLEKRRRAMKELASRLPDVFMAAAGATSINFTDTGENKATGISRALERLKMRPSDAVFVGDSFDEGGNDAPVLGLGIETIRTKGPKETERIVALLKERLI